MNEEDQELAVQLTKRAEINLSELSYWWSGLVHLKSQTWIWFESERQFVYYV